MGRQCAIQDYQHTNNDVVMYTKVRAQLREHKAAQQTQRHGQDRLSPHSAVVTAQGATADVDADGAPRGRTTEEVISCKGISPVKYKSEMHLSRQTGGTAQGAIIDSARLGGATLHQRAREKKTAGREARPKPARRGRHSGAAQKCGGSSHAQHK